MFLTTGHECDPNNPNAAHFKRNKNRPRRLSFLANYDPKDDKEEEWCIRNCIGRQIQVTPDSDGHNPFTNFTAPQVYFMDIAE